MPVKMIAVGRYYDRHAGKEYKNGDSFSVADEVTAARLERTKKAKRDTVAAKAAAPVMKNRVMRAEAPAAEPAPAPETPSGGITYTTDNNAPSGEINANKPNRYRRSDMRSED